MPDYATHQKVNSIVLTVYTAFIITMFLMSRGTLSGNHVIFALSFVISSYCLTPDLDTKSIPFYRWSVLKVFWSMFQRVSKHRGILHNPIFSPIILCFPLIMVQWKLGFNEQIMWIIAGITVQIWTHIEADWLISSKKRIKG